MDGHPISTGRLARYGFADTERAGGQLAALGLWDPTGQQPADPAAPTVLDALSRAADPDLALRQLHRLAEAESSSAASTGPSAAGPSAAG
ncbi:MAG: hypothetical protein J2P15_10900, partial [Micromonosporaceae bacterium]|nr:hypothetical protein [Micromonosporaceae bacterium]